MNNENTQKEYFPEEKSLSESVNPSIKMPVLGF